MPVASFNTAIPPNAIGQRADGSFILAPASQVPFTASGAGAGLPQISSLDVLKGTAGAYQKARDNFIQPLIKYNEKAQDLVDKYAPTPSNIIDKAGDLLGGWETVGERISSGGGLLTSPKEIAQNVGDAAGWAGGVVGNTVSEAVKPVLVPLLLGVAVYAFASN